MGFIVKFRGKDLNFKFSVISILSQPNGSVMSGFPPMMPSMSQHHLGYGGYHMQHQHQHQQQQQQQQQQSAPFIEQQNRIGFLEQKVNRLEGDNQMLHQQNTQIRGQYTQGMVFS